MNIIIKFYDKEMWILTKTSESKAHSSRALRFFSLIDIDLSTMLKTIKNKNN